MCLLAIATASLLTSELYNQVAKCELPGITCSKSVQQCKMTMLFTTGLTYKKRRHFSQVCDTSPLWWVQTHFGIRVSAMPYTEYDFEYRSPQWDTSSWATMAPDFNRLIRSHHTAQSASHVSRFVIFLVLKIIFYSLARQSKKTSPKMTRAIHLRPLPSPSCRVSQTACNP